MLGNSYKFTHLPFHTCPARNEDTVRRNHYYTYLLIYKLTNCQYHGHTDCYTPIGTKRSQANNQPYSRLSDACALGATGESAGYGERDAHARQIEYIPCADTLC